MYKLTLAILATLIAAIYSRDVESLISTVNQKQSSWVAGHNKFSGMPLDEVKKILGLRDTRATPEQLRLGDSVYEKPLYTTADNDLPEEYDGRKQWGACLQPVRNQEHCGSCWAFSAAETLGNRFCRASNGTVNVVLSPQDLVSCSYLNFGCNGGTLPMVWASMYFSGIVPDKCMPYVSGDGHVPSCPAVCPGGGEYAGKTLKSVKYFAKSIYPLWVDMPSRRVNDMKKDLVEHGAIQVGFSVYEDFLQYKSGVYQHTSGGFLGGHAVVIIGYTRDAWIVRNSWSESWGENGDFRIRIGHDECGIEGGAWAGLPKVNN